MSSDDEPFDDDGDGGAQLFVQWLEDERAGDQADENSEELAPQLAPTELANDIRVRTGMGRYGLSPISIATVLEQRSVAGPLPMSRQRLINCLLLPTHPRRVSTGCVRVCRSMRAPYFICGLFCASASLIVRPDRLQPPRADLQQQIQPRRQHIRCGRTGGARDDFRQH